MKTGFTLLLISLILTGCGVFSGAGRETSGAGQKDLDQTYRMIEQGNYQFTVQSINPTGGRSIPATSSYALRVEEGRYEADLPYFGRAYTAPYGGTGGGIRFDGVPEDLEVKENESRGTVRVSFSIGDAEVTTEKYTVNLTVSADGYGTMTVNSRNRQTISYYGRIGGIR